MGSVVIFFGACVAMFLPIARLVHARFDHRNKPTDHDPEHLRGQEGDYAVVEGAMLCSVARVEELFCGASVFFLRFASLKISKRACVCLCLSVCVCVRVRACSGACVCVHRPGKTFVFPNGLFAALFFCFEEKIDPFLQGVYTDVYESVTHPMLVACYCLSTASKVSISRTLNEAERCLCAERLDRVRR